MLKVKNAQLSYTPHSFFLTVLCVPLKLLLKTYIPSIKNNLKMSLEITYKTLHTFRNLQN